MDSILVGRSEELALIRASLDGSPGGCVLAGSAGVGKTRLARDVYTEALAGGACAMWFAATRAAATIPFGAVVDLVPEDFHELSHPAAVLRSIRAALQAKAAGRAVLVVLDDAHAADDATATVVHQLATTGAARVVVTVRTGEPVPDAIAALWKDGLCARLDVQPLSQSELSELAEAVVGGQIDALSKERLWQSTTGNPLLLRELVVTALEVGALREQHGVWQWEPSELSSPRLVDVVQERIADVDEQGRELLVLVAFGEPLPVDMVGSTRALPGLLERGLLVEVDVGNRWALRFSHPLYGDVLRDTAPSTDAKVACTRLLDGLLRGGALNRGDHRRAAAWALQAGVDLPLEVVEFAAREALSAGDTVLARRIAEMDHGAVSPATQWVVGQSLVYERRAFAEAERILASAAEVASDDDLVAAIAMARLEALAVGLDDVDAAEAVVTDGLRRLREPLPIGLLLARWSTVVADRDPQEAIGLVETLLADPDERVPLRAVAALQSILLPAGRLDRLDEVTSALLPAAQRHRDEVPDAPFTVFAARVFILMLLGRLDEAESLVHLADSAVTDIDRRHARGYFSMALGRLELARGRAAAAIPLLRDGVALLGRDVVERSQQAACSAWLAEAYALVGDPDGARGALVHAADALDDANVLHAEVARAGAWALVAERKITAARESLLSCAEHERAIQAPVFELLALHDVARLGGARRVAGRARELAGHVDGRLLATMVEHVVALAEDDGPALDAVTNAFAELGSWLWAAEAATSAAAAHTRRGLRARRAGCLAHASTLRRRCGYITTPALEIQDLPTPLTAREREVVELAGQGRTNREIADELVVSIRTVEGHLLRAFVKLDVTSRRELEAVAHSMPSQVIDPPVEPGG